MRLAFIDFIYHYDAARPDSDEPLGGTTSAICFVARELVKNGAACTFFNRVSQPRQAHGIASLPLQALGHEIERGGFDAYIFCGRWTAELVNLVRAHTKAPLIAWAHESAFRAPMTPALEAFDGVVFVSEWQQRVNQTVVKPHWKQIVIRNAMNPAVATSFPSGGKILPSKQVPPIMLFAGSFARGAFHIPPLLDKVRQQRNDFTVEMFCNLDPSRDVEKDTTYINWIRGLPNITHVGMVCDDIATTRSELESRGVDFLTEGIADVAGLRTTWCRDPWGTVIILMEKREESRPYWGQWTA